MRLSMRGGGLDGTVRWLFDDEVRLDNLDLSFGTAVIMVHALPGAPVSVTGDGTPAFWYRGSMPDGAGPLRLVVPAGLLTLKAGKAGEEVQRIVDLLPGAEATLGRD